VKVTDYDTYSLFLDDLPLTNNTLNQIKVNDKLKFSHSLDFLARNSFDHLKKETNPENIKKVLFDMRQKMTYGVFVQQFSELGGIDLVLDKILKYEVNIESYGLSVIRNAMSFNCGMQQVVSNENVIKYLFNRIDRRVVVNICRQALELLFVIIHYGGYAMVWSIAKERAAERKEAPLFNIIEVLGSGDIQTVVNAFTLIYGILKQTPQPKKYKMMVRLKYMGLNVLLNFNFVIY